MGEKRKRSEEASETGLVVSRVEYMLQKNDKTEIDEPTPPLPLTEDNLRLLEGIAMPQTPSQSKSGKANSSDVAELLEEYNLFMDDRKALERVPQIKAKALDIVDQERQSVISPEEIDNIHSFEKFFAGVNEKTLLGKFWPKLIREDRSVRGSEVAEDNQTETVVTKWEDCHLVRLEDQAFYEDLLPLLNPDNDEFLKEVQASLPKMATPQPDYCFGLLREAFTKNERRINTLYRKYAKVARKTYHAFFIVEFKTSKGDWEEGRTQCCRQSAALVHAMRELKKASLADKNDPLKDDHLAKTPCFAFSLLVSPSECELHVNWAECSSNGEVAFHMDRVRDYLLARDDELAILRHDVNNILDWGLNDRKDEVKDILAGIRAKGLDKESKVSKGSSEGRPGKKQRTSHATSSDVS